MALAKSKSEVEEEQEAVAAGRETTMTGIGGAPRDGIYREKNKTNR
jgi:hypothetical protein